MARHFEAKLDLFGPSKLCHEITQNDLNPGDMDALVTGIGHLPIRDSVGRLVRVSFSHDGLDIAGSSMEIVSIYYFMTMYMLHFLQEWDSNLFLVS